MNDLIEYLQNISSDEFIWWSGFNEKNYHHNTLFYNFLKENSNVVLCVHNNKWYYRKILSMLPSFLRKRLDNNKKPYISKYFSVNKQILIATNNDVGLKIIDEDSKKIITKYKEEFNFSETGKFIMQNPKTGLGYPHIRDSFNTIPTNTIIYSKGLSVKGNSQLKPLPNGINWEDAKNKVQFIKSLYLTKKKHSNLLYINFNKKGIGSFGQVTNDERPMLIEMFENKSYVTNGEGRGIEFLEEIYHHTFCLSPEGNCADSHRTWESLYLGTIPIVKKTDAMSWFDDLPILQVEDWNIITEKYLEEQYNRIINKKYNFEKLTMTYYINSMKENLNNEDE